MKNLFIGLMSGTSVDSIDSALVNIDKGSLKILETHSSSIKKNSPSPFSFSWEPVVEAHLYLFSPIVIGNDLSILSFIEPLFSNELLEVCI